MIGSTERYETLPNWDLTDALFLFNTDMKEDKATIKSHL